MLNHIRTNAAALWARITTHRALYAGLSMAHAQGCWLTEYPQLYAPMAVLYAVLAWRG
jgi:hypothetical protein